MTCRLPSSTTSAAAKAAPASAICSLPSSSAAARRCGAHPHETNGEAYYILEGAATVTEDGESRELHAGDAEFCADGHTHSIRNHTGSVTRFLAVIVPNR